MTLVVYIYIICGYQTSRHQAIWHKTLMGKRLPHLVDVVYQCIIVISVTLLFSWGTGCQCILMRLTEQKLMVTMAKQDLKKCWMCPHVSTMDNISDPVVMICAQWLWENHDQLWETHGACLQATHRVCMRALQSEGKIILIYSYFEIRVYFHPY